MSVLKLRKDQFKIARQTLDRRTFDEWINDEGRHVHLEAYKAASARWFFGKARARQKLYKIARKALTPQAPFVKQLENNLQDFTVVIRKLAVAIRKRGHKDLSSADNMKALVVVPRGIIQVDFRLYVQKNLADSPYLTQFPGLARRVIEVVTREAESRLFHFLEKGGQQVDATKKGLLMGVDRVFPWKLNESDGHYYYAYTGSEYQALTDKKTLRQFTESMEEVMYGQAVYLKRLNSLQRAEVTETFGAIARKTAKPESEALVQAPTF